MAVGGLATETKHMARVTVEISVRRTFQGFLFFPLFSPVTFPGFRR